MSELNTQKVHAAEFKAQMRRKALQGMQTINAISQGYGAHPVQLGQRAKAIRQQAMPNAAG